VAAGAPIAEGSGGETTGDSMKYGRFNWRPLSFQNLVLEGHTFRIVFREPGLRGVLVGEYLARDAP
jgi:hypothetical protein